MGSFVVHGSMLGKFKWAPFGPTCIKLYDSKLGIIRVIISEHDAAMGTVNHAFQPVTQLVAQSRSVSWLSRCKREKCGGVEIDHGAYQLKQCGFLHCHWAGHYYS